MYLKLFTDSSPHQAEKPDNLERQVPFGVIGVSIGKCKGLNMVVKVTEFTREYMYYQVHESSKLSPWVLVILFGFDSRCSCNGFLLLEVLEPVRPKMYANQFTIKCWRESRSPDGVTFNNSKMERSEIIENLKSGTPAKKVEAAELLLSMNPNHTELRLIIVEEPAPSLVERAWDLYDNDMSARSKDELLFIKAGSPVESSRITADELLTWKFPV
jgi:hypothetical protein